jgi:hypothetical protein
LSIGGPCVVGRFATTPGLDAWADAGDASNYTLGETDDSWPVVWWKKISYYAWALGPMHSNSTFGNPLHRDFCQEIDLAQQCHGTEHDYDKLLSAVHRLERLLTVAM